MCINWSTIGHKLTLCITAMAVCGHRLGLKIASDINMQEISSTTTIINASRTL